MGGGSTVNWSASLRTPRHVLRGWSDDLHMRQFDPDDGALVYLPCHSLCFSFVQLVKHVNQLLLPSSPIFPPNFSFHSFHPPLPTFSSPTYLRSPLLSSAPPSYLPSPSYLRSLTVGPDSFNASLDAVHGLLSVNSTMSHQQHPPITTQPTPPQSSPSSFVTNENNRMLWSSAEVLGLLPEVIPRNVKGCVDCGHCSHGCPYDAKQSTATALIEPILQQQQQQQQQPPQQQAQSQATSPSGDNDKGGRGRLTLMANCQVLRILAQPISSSSSSSSSDGYSTMVSGVEALWSEYPAVDPLHHPLGPDRAPPTTTKRLFFHASIVVSSSGALHTPALLLRSGLKHPKIGRHLCLHPVVAVAGLMSNDVDTGLSKGVGMGVIVRSTKAKVDGTNATTKCTTTDADNVDPSSSNISTTLCRGLDGVTPRCQEVRARGILGH